MSKTPEREGSAAMKRIYDKLAQEGGGTWAIYMMMDIDGVIAEARADAIEECAKLADEYAKDWGLALGSPATILATAIRRIKPS